MTQDSGGWGFTPPDDAGTHSKPMQDAHGTPWGEPTPASSWDGPPQPGVRPPGPASAPPGFPVSGGQPGPGAHPGAVHAALQLSARPGVIPLRPLTIGEIFDGAFQVMRRQPIPVFGSAGVVAALAGLLTILMQAVMITAARPTGTISGAGIAALVLTAVAAGLVLLVVQALVVGVLVLPTARAATGHSSTFSGVWKEASSRILPLVGWPVLQALGAIAGVTLLLGPAIVLGIAVDPDFLALLFLTVPALFALFLWAMAKFSFVPSVIMLEEVGLFAAIARSYRLTKGVFWRVAGILILTSIIASIVSAVVQAPFSMSGGFLSGLASVGSGEVPLAGLTLGAIGQTIGMMVSIPFTACVITLLYVDVRMRREGLHIELARAAAR